jgi:aminomethyltransferase
VSAKERLRRTPLHARHVALGARMVPFGGWDMPVQYTGILDEHRAVRESVGLFDVSHMGQIWLRGPEAVAAAERLLTCPVASLRPGRVRYGLLCNERGGVVDDVTVYRVADDELFLCVNAANIEKDWRWVVRHAGDAQARDQSDATGLLAIQGPESAALLARAAADPDPGALGRFRFRETKVAGVPALVSRTGYTGSDGFEIYLPAGETEAVFDALLEAGATPVGLGARDTLRLEAALPLYGHELDDETTPLEAGLERFVKLDAGGFLGAEALRAQAEAGLTRRLVGFVLDGRGVARAEHALARDGETIGRVTSGAPSPTLGKSIGLGYVPTGFAETGTRLDVLIRDRAVAAHVVDVPFVTKASVGGQSGG